MPLDPRLDLVRYWFRRKGETEKTYWASPISRAHAEDLMKSRCRVFDRGYDEMPGNQQGLDSGILQRDVETVPANAGA